MKVSFDIDTLLEELNDESTGTIISLIEEPEVLEHIVNEHIVEFGEDKMYVNALARYILNNHNTDSITIETIATCVKNREISALLAYKVVNHPNATENTKNMMEEFI